MSHPYSNCKDLRECDVLWRCASEDARHHKEGLWSDSGGEAVEISMEKWTFPY